MAPRKWRNLPFRIPRVPFFRIFYSTTYTIIFAICLCVLAITPGSMIYTSIEKEAYQYIFMIGGTYVLTAILAIFIYSSRLYTNRAVLAGVGKAYVPIEEGEIGKKVRRMIVKQMERSAVVAWECRPRDLDEEIYMAERQGSLPTDNMISGNKDSLIGTIIAVDPARPPWGHVQHAGWSSPSRSAGNAMSHVQFADVIAELPHLVEARAVSMAPLDPSSGPENEDIRADPAIVETLRRPEAMGIRDYLTQLSYLGILSNSVLSESFLKQYETARFSGRPIDENNFQRLMATFSDLLSGITELDPAIIEQIRIQTQDDESLAETRSMASSQTGSMIHHRSPRRPSFDSSSISPVTARTRPSRAATPFLQNDASTVDSFGSVIHRTPTEETEYHEPISSSSGDLDSSSTISLQSTTGSVVRYNRTDEPG
ncbi:Hypothetical protein R9X50_00309300 [Acrodontium crateriforme]|uniref:Defect at low temperature protein 1 n=1 Tax=Acrodontium crateriforme TaxID=150365 RepID=A0AAQ3R761_9PEZI|nr:Hypothetical protein R9X50_00309300 [Acrodontium crateriforme]